MIQQNICANISDAQRMNNFLKLKFIRIFLAVTGKKCVKLDDMKDNIVRKCN